MKSRGVTVYLQIIEVDVAESVNHAVSRIKKDFGSLDVLVNNAGIIKDRGISILDVEESIIKETFETNFFGALSLIQASVPLMIEQGYGRIVNLSSGLGAFEILKGLGGLKGSSGAYRISKTMLNALTCLMAKEITEQNIKVNAVCPGSVQTDMGGENASSTVVEGADTAVWLATLDEDGPNGGFFRNRQNITW
jgi:NAD(P)-dependent dehydrogenase (short-subunit alcohol dehydrogenase family)